MPECHRIVLADGKVTLDLWFGDIKDSMPTVPNPEQGTVDAWFLDGFAPSKNPEMWNQNLFDGMARLAKQNCTCATFTAAGFVRRGLIEAGFEMKKVKGFGTKRDMIAGTVVDKKPTTNIKPWYFRPNATATDDIAIIGGGIASAALAKALTERGLKPTLYCKDEKPAQGASGNRQGAVYPLLNGDHSGVSRMFAPAFLYARQFVEKAARQLEFDHDWCGVTQLMWDEKSQVKLNKMIEGNFPTGLIRALSAEQTQQTIGLPIDVGSVSYPLGGWLCPAQLTQSLLNDLEQNLKLVSHYRCEVLSLDWNDKEQHWVLETSKGQFTHKTVVVANGHEFSKLAPCQDVPLGQVKGQVSHIPTTDRLSELKTVLCYDGYMTPCNPKNQHHCIGASYDRDNLDTEFDPFAQQDNGEKLTRCLPRAEWANDVDTSGNQSRQGIRCVSRDHLPFVGSVGQLAETKALYQDLVKQSESSAEKVPVYPNLFCLLGLGSRGLSSAPLLAEVLASQICGDALPLPTDVLEQLHPSRMWVKKLRKGKMVD